MKPGPELDTLIAEKIFGDRKILLPNKPRGLEWAWGSKEGCLWYDVQTVHSYSTNTSFALEVVEKLRSRQYSIDIGFYPECREWLKPPHEGAPAQEWSLTKGEMYYQCRISKCVDYLWISVADECGESMSHAICLSALKTLEFK